MSALAGLTIVIPALNEAATIGDVVRSALGVGSAVLVVDDGSTDGTGELARAAGAAVVRHEAPGGYDAAIADGLNEAFRQGATAAVTMDADGQHRLEDVERVSRPVLEEGLDLCAGVRDRYNRAVEALVGVFARPTLGTPDPFCGLKCYHRRLFEACGPFPARLNIGTVPLVWVRRGKRPHRYLPIQVRPRHDQPRFGRLVRASLKLAGAFLSTLGDWISYPSSSRRA